MALHQQHLVKKCLPCYPGVPLDAVIHHCCSQSACQVVDSAPPRLLKCAEHSMHKSMQLLATVVVPLLLWV